MPPQSSEFAAVVQADQIIWRDGLPDRQRGLWRLDDGRSNPSPVHEFFKAECSPSNRAASAALGTELFATNAVRISAANSIGSDVATGSPGLRLRSDSLTPRPPLVNRVIVIVENVEIFPLFAEKPTRSIHGGRVRHDPAPPREDVMKPAVRWKMR